MNNDGPDGENAQDEPKSIKRRDLLLGGSSLVAASALLGPQELVWPDFAEGRAGSELGADHSWQGLEHAISPLRLP
jgi:hypothetical protein